jgi:hypothetical protein
VLNELVAPAQPPPRPADRKPAPQSPSADKAKADRAVINELLSPDSDSEGRKE